MLTTLIITDKPMPFKANNTTIVNCENKYTDANVTIIKLCSMARIMGIRANKVIIYAKSTNNIVDKLRYNEWLWRCPTQATTRNAVIVYVKDGYVAFTGNRGQFYDYIKEVSL